MKKGVMGIILFLLVTGIISAQGENLGKGSAVMNQNQINSNNANEESLNQKMFFCGTSTFGSCELDEDCLVGGCSNAVCQSKNEEPAITTCIYSECQNAEKYHAKCLCIDKKCKWNRLNDGEIKNLIRERNKLKIENKTECLFNCTCDGNTVKCGLKANREMTVYAGNSGNIIVQIKGENMSTNVTLYKSDDGKIYILKGNETREIKMLPDQVRERIKERLQTYFQNENMTLNENGTYNYIGSKEAKLFSLFPIKVRVMANIDSETGNISNIRTPWWAFLAKDKEQEQLVGSSCGTVTPGYNNKCCQTKGYDVWNSEAGECKFSD